MCGRGAWSRRVKDETALTGGLQAAEGLELWWGGCG